MKLLSVFCFFLLAGCGGPIAILPGGQLSGEVAAFSASVIPTDAGVIQLETRPADPYSVNIGCVVIDQQIYIDPAEDRAWYQHIKADANVRLRFDGTETVYLAKATRVEDEAILAQFEADRVILRLEPRSY